jgi:hypothetical protein
VVSWAVETRDCGYSFGGAFHPIRYDDRQRIGQVLTDENVRSVNARYGAGSEDPREYVHSLWQVRELQPVEVLKALHGLNYQSCEAEGYFDTEAYAIIRGIESCAMRQLPGYDEAETWSILDPAPEARNTISIMDMIASAKAARA